MIKTVDQFIQACGGMKEFGAIVGRSLPPVYRAKDENHIPYKWRPALYQEAQKRRLAVAPELLGFGSTR